MPSVRYTYFFIYLFMLYLANLGAVSSGYAFYSLGNSLSVLGYSKAFVGFCTAFPRYILIFLSFYLYKNSHKVNKINLSILSALIAIFSFSALAFSQTAFCIIFFAGLYGVTTVASMSYMPAMVLEYTPEAKRLSVLGIFTTSTSIAAFLGPFVAEHFFSWGGKDNPNYILFSGAFFAIFWLLFLLIAHLFSKKLEKPVIKSLFLKEESKSVRPKFYRYFPLIPFIFMMGLIFSSLLTFISGYSSENHLPSAEYFFLGFSLCSLLIRFFYYKVFSSLSKRKLLVYGFSFYFTALFGVCLLKNLAYTKTLIFIGIFLGIGDGLLYPTLSVLFADISPNHTAHGSLALVISFFSGFLLTPIVGYIADFLGFQAMFMILFLLSGVILIKSFLGKRVQVIFRLLEKKKSRNEF